MGARVYDPYTGTFTQPDPIQGGGANAYGYTDGDPVNEKDLSGDCVGELALDPAIDELCAELAEDAIDAVGRLLLGGAATAASIEAAHLWLENNPLGSTSNPVGANGPSGVVFAKGGKQNIKLGWAPPPLTGENGKTYAGRVMDAKYGAGNYNTGPGSDYSKLKKSVDKKK